MLGFSSCFIECKAMTAENMTNIDSCEGSYETFNGESFFDEVVVEAKQGSYKHVVEVYPKEVYLGDPIYIASYYENLTDRAIFPFLENRMYPMYVMLGNMRITFAAENVDETYSYKSKKPECEWWYSLSSRYATGVLNPKSFALGQFNICELPPLEDWQSSFWQKVREQMTPEGVWCSVTFGISYFVPNLTERNDLKPKYESRQVVCKVLVRPRPETESETISKWYSLLEQNEKPENKFDRGVEYCNKEKVDKYGLENEPSGVSDIKIAGKAYNPWHFIRFGNRKPSIPNNPTTIEGWRELEGSLSPSTMRDEIHLTRLLLEYYSARTNKERELTKHEICDWLKTLPRPQRLALCPSKELNGGRIAFKSGDPLNYKLQALIRAIEDENVEFEFEREW